MKTSIPRESEGWMFYSSEPRFVEDITKIAHLVGSICYEVWSTPDLGHFIRRS